MGIFQAGHGRYWGLLETRYRSMRMKVADGRMSKTDSLGPYMDLGGLLVAGLCSRCGPTMRVNIAPWRALFAPQKENHQTTCNYSE